MSIEIKYRHPIERSMTWSGRGKAPKWYSHALENGFIKADLLIEYQKHVAESADEMDLGIGNGSPTVAGSNYQIVADISTDEAHQSIARDAAVLVPGKSNTKTFSDFIISDAEHALAEFLEIDLAASPAVLLSRVRDDSRRLLVAEIGMGLRLIALKSQLEHGEFLPALAEIGIAEHTAQGAMRTARAFAAEGDARRRQQLLDMGKTKGAALLAAKPEVRESIMGDQDLSREVQEATFLELQALLKEKELQIERHQKAYADLETQLEIRNLEMQRLTKIDPVALLTRSVRAEAVANAAAIGELCDNLIRLADAVLDESIAAEQREIRERAVGAAVGAAMAHLQALQTALEGHLSGFPELTALDDLTQDEISRAVKCRAFIDVQFAQRLTNRRDEVYAEHLADGGAKRRGRPPKKAEGK